MTREHFPGRLSHDRGSPGNTPARDCPAPSFLLLEPFAFEKEKARGGGYPPDAASPASWQEKRRFPRWESAVVRFRQGWRTCPQTQGDIKSGGNAT